MNDVVERLRDRNPVTDLVAVGEGVQPLELPEAVPARRRHRRRLGAVATVVLVAVAALVLAGLPGDDASGPTSMGRVDVATAAARALDPGTSILHIVTRTRQAGPDVRDGVVHGETWLGPGGRSGRVRLVLDDGTVIGDDRIRHAGAGPGSSDPISAARAMLREGLLKPAGLVTRDGRRLQRFRNARGDVTWYFDPRTLFPVSTVLHPTPRHGRFVAVSTITRYERLADTARNRRLLIPARRIVPRPPGAETAPTRTTPHASP